MSRKIPTTVECLNAQKSQSPFVDKSTVPSGFLGEHAATRELFQATHLSKMVELFLATVKDQFKIKSFFKYFVLFT